MFHRDVLHEYDRNQDTNSIWRRLRINSVDIYSRRTAVDDIRVTGTCRIRICRPIVGNCVSKITTMGGWIFIYLLIYEYIYVSSCTLYV